MARDEMLRALESRDVARCWAIWACVSPHLGVPKDFAEAETTMHYARTASKKLRFQHRAYSHRWLNERGLPSGLPDEMRPMAERLYPRVVEGVGLATHTRSALALAIREACEQAVLECYADGKTHPDHIKARLRAARARVLKGD